MTTSGSSWDDDGDMSSNGPSFTVVIVGDDALRHRVEPLLEGRDSLLVIGSVDADQGVTTALGRAPDVVVIADQPGGGETAASLGGQIGAALPATRLLVVTQGRPATDPASLIDAWVGGVVDLDAGMPLAEAVERLALGEGILDAGLAAAVLERHRAGTGTGVEPLTATEDEVLTRLAAGAEVDVLAAEYAVSARLVRQHAGGALARLHPPA
jgi:two-component system, NarL family, response regulator DesR